MHFRRWRNFMTSLIEKMHYNCNALLFHQLVIQKILFKITLCFRNHCMQILLETDTALGTKTNQLTVLDLIYMFFASKLKLWTDHQRVSLLNGRTVLRSIEGS